MKNKNVTMLLDENDTKILWELMNASGVAVPPREAAKVASLYAKVRSAAEAHLLLEPDRDQDPDAHVSRYEKPD